MDIIIIITALSVLSVWAQKASFDVDEIMSYRRVIHQYLLLQFIDILSFLFAWFANREMCWL